jgi:CTP:molybdopterin cytidylyltransferase MocA
VVLAAGAGSRFGGAKLLASLHGRPILQHVLDHVAECGLRETVVVLGEDADELEAALTWRDERRVRNSRPGDGLSSSLRLGLAAVRPEAGAALIVLGDQPSLRTDIVSALLVAPVGPEHVAVVPHYVGGGDPNPVLLLRAGWPLVDEASGDRGLGPLLAQHPERVRGVAVPGFNPDIDTPDDLARLEHEPHA